MNSASSDSRHVVYVDSIVADLIPHYLAKRRRDCHQIATSLGNRNFAVIRRLGHNMKGSGRGYGFPQISELGDQLEKSALRHDLRMIDHHRRALRRYLKSIDVKVRDCVI